ncbi:MAG: FtsX-like permease family protein [Clostridium sp.]
MINKLVFRNAQKSIKDYLLYLITMIIISALMFAFNSMIFSKDIAKLCNIVGVMETMIVLALVFIAFIVAWLINYMIKFIMGKKSKEFGIYMLLGMKKKEIASIFIKENALIGILAFFWEYYQECFYNKYLQQFFIMYLARYIL